MKNLFLLLTLAILISCSNKPETESVERLSVSYFPEKTSVLSETCNSMDNLLPFALVKIKLNGEIKKIPIVYAYFDPSRNNANDFPEHYGIDNYSFSIDKNGFLTPNFDLAAFQISDDHLDYFNQSLEKYSKKKMNQNSDFINLSREKPGWWQGDETPASNEGGKSIFICQAAMSGAIKDDGMMYVFYNQTDEQIDVVIQRD